MKLRIMKLGICSFIFALPFLALAQDTNRKSGSPLDHLPDNIQLLTTFGERADFSPDNKSVAFVSKSFGDAMVVDIETRTIRCLTCDIPGAAFLRVMHLITGDYLLFGPEKFEDIRVSRSRDNELWFLSKEPGSKPVKLGLKIMEGAAISKKSLRIAYSQRQAHSPEIPEGATRIIVADVDISGGIPRIINRKTVFESPDRSCVAEAQDFYDNDSKLTFSCYEPGHRSSVMGLDLETGEVTNFTPVPNTYNEPEGILPGGNYTLVESDEQTERLGGERGPGNIDIWKLKLDSKTKDFVQLTYFNDFEGCKASNPVISTDGKWMAFQLGFSKDATGVGHGILLYEF